MNEITATITTNNTEGAIDTTAIAKEKSQILDSFFATIKRAGELLSEEDIDVAMKSLKVASLEMKEKERKRRLEEEAILKEKKELEQLEVELEQLEAEKAALEQALSSGTLSVDELTKSSERIGVVIDLLDEKGMRWLELSDI